jgi:signal transduction histidine kinase
VAHDRLFVVTVIETVDQKRYRFIIGALMAVLTATPGVLSVLGSFKWEVVILKMSYGLPLLWWRRPALSFGLTTTLILVSEVSLASFGQSSGEWAFIPLSGAAFVIGLNGLKRDQLRCALGFVLAVAVGIVTNQLIAPPGFGVGLSIAVNFALIAVAWMVGDETQRIRQRAQLAEFSLQRATLNADAQTRHAVKAERLRIAHDIHDLASHSLSALVVRTELAQMRLGDLDQQLVTEFQSIGDDGRRAMEQLRSMLIHVDRSDQGQWPNGIDLDHVLSSEVDASRRSNTIIHKQADDLPFVSQDVAQAVQRFVREALVNADQHAQFSEVKVAARFLDDSIVISVRNDAGMRSHTDAVSSGLGLTLTRIRLAEIGATLCANATLDGGFEATITLPWPSRDTGDSTMERVHSVNS